jgi:hypothetical protein
LHDATAIEYLTRFATGHKNAARVPLGPEEPAMEADEFERIAE